MKAISTSWETSLDIPEWIDFPRAGNNNSYWYARRQWHLVDDNTLYYKHLNAFDIAMQQLDIHYHLLSDEDIQLLFIHEDAKQIVYSRGGLVFAFNLHPTVSATDLCIPVPERTDYRIILNSDDTKFGGYGAAEGIHYPWQDVEMEGYPQSVQLYLPAEARRFYPLLGENMKSLSCELLRTDFGHEVYDRWYLEHAKHNFEAPDFVQKHFSFYEKVLQLTNNDRIIGCRLRNWELYA